MLTKVLIIKILDCGVMLVSPRLQEVSGQPVCVSGVKNNTANCSCNLSTSLNYLSPSLYLLQTIICSAYFFCPSSSSVEMLKDTVVRMRNLGTI